MIGAAAITREIFWNVPDWARVGLYALAAPVVAFVLAELGRRWLAARRARPDPPGGERLSVIRAGAWSARRLWRSPLAGLSHAFLAGGFVVLFTGTCIVALEHLGRCIGGGEPLFFQGSFYTITSALLDLFGLLFIAGVVVAAARSLLDRRFPPTRRARDRAGLLLLLLVGATGFAVEAARIAALEAGGAELPGERWCFVGRALASILGSLPSGALRSAHVVAWIVHALLSLLLVAMLARGRLLHIFSGLAIACRAATRPVGRLTALSPEEVTATGRHGVVVARDLTRHQVVSSLGCAECGRCAAVCPATRAGEPLSPLAVVEGIARAALAGGPVVGSTVSPESVGWCTTCGACAAECPLGIDPLDLIVDLRRGLVAEGKLPSAFAAPLRALRSRGNPWGFPIAERGAWTRGLDVPTLEEEPSPDVLLWVGCSGSWDPRARRVSRALVALLREAGVRFAIAGARERCTGDLARRLGEELLWRELIEHDVRLLEEAGFPRVVTPCPHCLASLEDGLRELGGGSRVSHHSELLEELLDEGRLVPRRASGLDLVYHDPCVLGRMRGEYEAPRRLLDAAGGRRREVRASGARANCCGAGGGRAFGEESREASAPDALRWAELTEPEPDVVAVACPFCAGQLAGAAERVGSPVPTRDIAELLADAVLQGGRGEPNPEEPR